jgi:GT2 family glycosyltransferase
MDAGEPRGGVRGWHRRCSAGDVDHPRCPAGDDHLPRSIMTAAVLPQTHADRARAYVERGRRFHADGDVARARELFRRAIIHDTRSDDASRRLMATYEGERAAHRLSVILPTWNRLPHLRHCLDSLRRNSFYDNEIIVIDNNSQDGTVDYLRAQTDIRVIFSPAEIAVVPAANLGFAAATGDIIGILNDDVEVLPGWDLEIAQTLATERRVGAVTPTVINRDGTLHCWGHYHPFTSFAYPWVGQVTAPESPSTGEWPADHPAFHAPRECDYGVFPFFTRECFERVGGFDERYLHYFADPDFGYRIQEIGLRNVHCPTSLVIHLYLGQHLPERTNERFKHDVDAFGTKWFLQNKGNGEPAIRHSYLYFDRYYEHLRAERLAGGAAANDAADLADWLPDSCRDIIVIGGESGVADALRHRGAHVATVEATGRPQRLEEPPPIVADMSFLPLGCTACDAIVGRFALSRSCWPLVTLLEFNRVLDSDGHLLLTLPPYEEEWIQHPDHPSVWTEALWRRAFADTGFTTVRAETPEGGGRRSEQRYLLRKVRALFVPHISAVHAGESLT